MSYIHAHIKINMSLEKVEKLLEELVTNQRANSMAIQTNSLKLHTVKEVVLLGLRTKLGTMGGKMDAMMEALREAGAAPMNRLVVKEEQPAEVKTEEKKAGDGERVSGAGQRNTGGAGMHGDGAGASGELEVAGASGGQEVAIVEVLSLNQVRERLAEKRKSFRSRDSRFETEKRLAGSWLLHSEQAKISLNKEILRALEEPNAGGPEENDGAAALDRLWDLVKGAATRNVEKERWVYMRKTTLVEIEMATSGEPTAYNGGKREEAGASALALGTGMIAIIRGESSGEWDNGAGLRTERGQEAMALIALGIYMIGRCW